MPGIVSLATAPPARGAESHWPPVPRRRGTGIMARSHFFLALRDRSRQVLPRLEIVGPGIWRIAHTPGDGTNSPTVSRRRVESSSQALTSLCDHDLEHAVALSIRFGSACFDASSRSLRELSRSMPQAGVLSAIRADHTGLPGSAPGSVVSSSSSSRTSSSPSSSSSSGSSSAASSSSSSSSRSSSSSSSSAAVPTA
jgi:hypothetical protein